MENQSVLGEAYHGHLNDLLRLRLGPEFLNFLREVGNQQDACRFQLALTQCQGTQYGQIQRTLITVKRQILLLLKEKYTLLQKIEQDMLREPISSLANISSELAHQQISRLYNELLDQQQKGQKWGQFFQTIGKILNLMKGFLDLPSGEERTGFGDGPASGDGDSGREAEDQKIERTSSQNGEDLEKCRICEQMISLNKLERHVNYCYKMEMFRDGREEAIAKQEAVVNQIREHLLQMGSQMQEQLHNILKSMMMYFTKLNRPKRKTALFRGEAEENQISYYLEAAGDKYPDNSFIFKFTHLEHEIVTFEKKWHILETQNYSNQSHQSNQSIQSSSKSIRSSRRLVTRHKTKKSLFAPRESLEEFSNQNYDHSQKKLSMKTAKKFRQKKSRLTSLKAEIVTQNKIELFYDIGCEVMHKSDTCIQFEENKALQTKFKNFQVLKFLGKGAFGKVYLVRRKNTMDTYAMKVIKIEKKWNQTELNLIENEHEIFRKIGGEYLVEASFSFNEGSAHFFVLEYVPRGDLSSILEEQVYLEQHSARFYLAEIILAIEHLHDFDIVHRDLKPENLVIDEKGHLKLTDFGLSDIRIKDKIDKVRRTDYNDSCIEDKQPLTDSYGKPPPRKSNTKIIGTPDYISPQIIERACLDSPSSDWWSLGVLAYEMLIGCRPFSDDTVEQVIENILQQKMDWPEIGDREDMISPTAADFIKKLLNPDYKSRLGAKDIQEIKSHSFFEGVDWESIREKNPPFLPEEKIKGMSELGADESLRLEIERMIKDKANSKRSLKISNFVNYGLLMNETLDSAERNMEEKNRRAETIKPRKMSGNSKKRSSIDFSYFGFPTDFI